MSQQPSQSSQQDVDRLWQSFAKTRDPKIKNELLLNYVDLVRSVVLRMMPVYRGYNEFDDLVSCGVLGLMDAIDKFDLSQNVKFQTYAAVRIRGEIIDHMRRSDWAPSSLRRKISAVNDAAEALENELSRSPTEEEIAAKLDMKPKDVRDVLEKSYMFNLVHFEDMLTETWTSIPGSADDESPEAFVENREVQSVLTDIVATLPEKERTVISLYYFEEMTLREIAEVLGVSESRVSQIHSKVLLKLRSQLNQAFSA